MRFYKKKFGSIEKVKFSLSTHSSEESLLNHPLPLSTQIFFNNPPSTFRTPLPASHPKVGGLRPPPGPGFRGRNRTRRVGIMGPISICTLRTIDKKPQPVVKKNQTGCKKKKLCQKYKKSLIN